MATSAEKREEIKRWFEDNGVSLTDWAAERGFKRNHVYDVLNGRAAGRRGIAHRIAVALGLKPGAGTPDPSRPSSKPDPDQDS